MNIKELKTILDSDSPEATMKTLIINSLATDMEIIPDIMKILNRERFVNKELILDMNLELSRAHIYVDGVTENKKQKKDRFNKEFVLGEIEKFYNKHKSLITHCFNTVRFNQ